MAKKKKINRFTPVLIEWYDTVVDLSKAWYELEDIIKDEKQEEKSMTHVSVGFVVNETNIAITLTDCYRPEPDEDTDNHAVGTPHKIPIGCIKKIKILKVPK